MEKLPEVMVRLENLSSLGPSFPFLYLNDDAPDEERQNQHRHNGDDTK
jgi:hypothetical protein